MLINDLVVLGRACPEPLKDGRTTVCLAGWSADYGFMRIYPTRRETPISRWDVIRLEVERNERDNRLESWKIAGSREEWDNLHRRVEVVERIKSPQQRRNLVSQLTDNCVEVFNKERLSLGIIKPAEILHAGFRPNLQYNQPYQLGLKLFTDFDEATLKRDFKDEPHLRYRCPKCQTSQGFHDQVVLEWGFYEWVRKNPDKQQQVWDNAKLYSHKHDIYLLVGNLVKHRNRFMVISVLRIPKGSVDSPLFPLRKRPLEDI